MSLQYPLFFACPPGAEPLLEAEARSLGFSPLKIVPGGVEAQGKLEHALRANLTLRLASRVLLRLATFRAGNLAELETNAALIPFAELLPQGTQFTVEAHCAKSKVYHSGAAEERVAKAAEAQVKPRTGDAEPVAISVRIVKDQCTVSLDTSGDLLHRRGFKRAVGKAPLRESLAALFLRACEYRPGEALVDPFCGSGTIPMEAAEMTLGLVPGRERSFAVEGFLGLEPETIQAVRTKTAEKFALPAPKAPIIFGSDRDSKVIDGAMENLTRAGLDEIVSIRRKAAEEMAPPEGVPPGLLLTNPPYGDRIGDKGALRALYASFGRIAKERFGGWRVGLITSDAELAKATRLPFTEPSAPVPHGALRIRLYQTGVL